MLLEKIATRQLQFRMEQDYVIGDTFVSLSNFFVITSTETSNWLFVSNT